MAKDSLQESPLSSFLLEDLLNMRLPTPHRRCQRLEKSRNRKEIKRLKLTRSKPTKVAYSSLFQMELLSSTDLLVLQTHLMPRQKSKRPSLQRRPSLSLFQLRTGPSNHSASTPHGRSKEKQIQLYSSEELGHSMSEVIQSKSTSSTSSVSEVATIVLKSHSRQRKRVNTLSITSMSLLRRLV